MKKIISIIVSILCAFCLSACGVGEFIDGIINPSSTNGVEDSGSALETPQNLRYDNGILKWSIVDNASSYVLVIDLDEYKVETNSFDVSDIRLSNGLHTAKVRAAKSGEYNSSAYSEVISFEIKGLTNVSTQTERYKIIERLDVPQLQYTYTQEENNVYIFYMGRIDNVPIHYGVALEYNGETESTLTYSSKDTQENAITMSKEDCIASTATVISEESFEKTTEHGVKLEIGFKKASGGISGSVNVKTTNANKQAVENTRTYSYSDVYTTFENYSQTIEKSITYTIGENHEVGCRYRLALFAQCDVYAFAVYNSEEQTISVSYDLSAIPSSLYLTIDKSKDGTFGVTEDYQELFVFDTEILKDSKLFEYKYIYSVSYELNGGTVDGAVSNAYTLNDIDLPTPKKDYYFFDGWYYDKALTEKATKESILKNPSDITLYAKWDTVEWVITKSKLHLVSIDGRNYNWGGWHFDLDENYLSRYAEDGYSLKITVDFAVIRYENDPALGAACIAIGKQDSAGNVAPTDDQIETVLERKEFSVDEMHKNYEMSLSTVTNPLNFEIKHLVFMIGCKSNDVGANMLASAQDCFTLLEGTKITISFVKNN